MVRMTRHVDDNTPDEVPSCLLQAASVIHKYVDLEDGHLARASDALLDSFYVCITYG